MDQTVQLSSLRSQIRFRADMGSQYLDDTNLNLLINARAKRLWGQMTQKTVDDYVKISGTLVITPGADNVPLPTDFFRGCGVDAFDGSNWVRLRRFALEEHNSVDTSMGLPMRYQRRGSGIYFTPTPPGSTQVRVLYIPRLPLLALDADTFDGVNGWEEYIVIDCAIQCRLREDTSVRDLVAERDRVKEELEAEEDNQDANEPMKVRDDRGWEFD